MNTFDDIKEQLEEKIYYVNDDETLKVTDTTVYSGSGSYPITDMVSVRMYSLLPAKRAKLIRNISIVAIILGIYLYETRGNDDVISLGFFGLAWWMFGFSFVRINSGSSFDHINVSLVRKVNSHEEQKLFIKAISKSLNDHKALMDRKRKLQQV